MSDKYGLTSLFPSTPAGRLEMLLELSSPTIDEDGTVIEPLLSVDDVREILDWVPLQAAGSGSTSK